MIRDGFRAWREGQRFRRLPVADRSIVFYSEDAASWAHFEPMVLDLTQRQQRSLCYLTSDPRDPILQMTPEGINAFYVGQGFTRTHLFMSLQARVMVMTMPDLETFHLKRSRLHDVHYVYVFHSMVSTHMIYRKGAFDAFDTVLCVGPHHIDEVRACEREYGLQPKQLIAHGYGKLDALLENKRTRSSGGSLNVVVAPSWGPHGLIENHGVDVVRVLLDAGYRVTVRPHPMTARKNAAAISALQSKFASNGSFELELDVGDTTSLVKADVLISDWSGVALEFAFGLEKPVLFVDVPRKINNPEYKRLDLVPLEVSIRQRIGDVVAPDRIGQLPQLVQGIARRRMSQELSGLREELVFNVGRSGEVAGEAIAAIADGGVPNVATTASMGVPS